MVIICRELDRSSGKVAVYPLKTDVTSLTISFLGMRSQANPELTYYVTMRDTYESNTEIVHKTLKRVNLTEKLLQSCADKIGCGIESL